MKEDDDDPVNEQDNFDIQRHGKLFAIEFSMRGRIRIIGFILTVDVQS
jgi:hypothetical protein